MIQNHGILQSGRSVGVTPPLDTYTGAVAAYSLRKLRSAYTGSAIRVRRASDNAVLDIGFDGSGNLNTSALLSFSGSVSSYVTIWYDQSGNARNASQSTANFQPMIVNNGTLQTVNNKPVLNFIRANTYYLSASVPDFRILHDIFAVLTSYGTQDAYDSYFGARGAQNANVLWHRSSSVNNAIGFTQPGNNIANNTSAANTNIKLLNAFATSSSLTFRDVGLNLSATGNLVDTSGTVNELLLAASSGGGSTQTIGDFLSLYFNEFILYNSDQSSNRSGINSNLNSYYTIY